MKKFILFVFFVVVVYAAYKIGVDTGRAEVASGEQICLKNFDNKYYCAKMTFGIIDGDTPFYKDKDVDKLQ